ncbi:Flp pilus assembly protein CpaB [Ferviditalea candida]|uniref:Flp pilus assembly protein CpaB n=1 Tax=Ferviditalea candida TaxID=3108399 RepID=A0ABU5ZF12_9BACL|nr:Flp pilus assembly protein CpaB [Paenibacillaceae bacterium T2]
MRSKIILIMAILMGLATTLLFYKYVSKFNNMAPEDVHAVEVLTAKGPIHKNQMISSDMIEKIAVPDQGIYKQAVKEGGQAIGKFALQEIAQGEPILAERLGTVKEESLVVSKKVKEGMRAVSIGVNFVQSVSNLIEPEDFVDVILTEKPKDAPEPQSSIVLENVHVLAVGRRMVEATKDTAYVEYSSATLEVELKDAVKLVNSAAKGSLQLILHSKLVPPAADTNGKGVMQNAK